MEQQFKCKKCNSENYKVINVQTQIKKNLQTKYVMFLTIFAVIAGVGIIMIISDALNLTSITNNFSYSSYVNNLDENIIEYLQNTAKVEEIKANIYIDASLVVLGFIGAAFTAIYYSIDPTYTITNEARKLCLNCGRKWKFKKIEEPDFEQEMLKKN